jgi:UDP-N-acetylmuramate--alanine ligase
VISTAIGEDNPELAAARSLGHRVLHRGELLAEVARMKRCLAVAGTHGKTTTASMIAHVLVACGRRPAYLIGGEVRSTGANASWGQGEWVVVEADESDRSFLGLAPEAAVVTNVELDHHATYRSLQELERAFAEFAGPVPVLVMPVGLELPGVPPSVTFGIDAGGLAGREVELLPLGSRCRADGVEVRLEVPGRHNVLNALAALAACREAGFQPHLYSRTKHLARAFGKALALADVVVVLDVYAARERADDYPGVSGWLVATAAADGAHGRPVYWLPHMDDAERFLRSELSDGDLLLTIGAGDVDTLARRLGHAGLPEPALEGAP